MNNNQHTGKVILAGAGPGDPELLTIKAFRWLQRADVVISDRLVSDVILEEYTNPDALVLHVGKQCSKGFSTPQSTINELLVEYALQGKLVVRLKGGDVSVFSNVLDELQVLVQHDIPYEIVPGITAALGAAAYAGIPLTARGYSTAVRFMTFYRKELLSTANWQDLAHSQDTLVFYMSSESMDDLIAQLISHGMSGSTPLALVEQATTPFQQVHLTNIGDFGFFHRTKNFVSPTLIIIGKTAGLHEQFRWVANHQGGENYFKPVADSSQASARA